jgi:hypothetical protein
MQINENSIVGTRSAALRLRRRGSELESVVSPMLHVAMPAFYQVTRRRPPSLIPCRRRYGL